MPMETIDVLGAFIRDELLSAVPDPPPIGPEDRLLAHQVIDSLQVVELVHFVETRFGIELDEDDLIEENFDTLGALARLIHEKRPGGAGDLG